MLFEKSSSRGGEPSSLSSPSGGVACRERVLPRETERLPERNFLRGRGELPSGVAGPSSTLSSELMLTRFSTWSGLVDLSADDLRMGVWLPARLPARLETGENFLNGSSSSTHVSSFSLPVRSGFSHTSNSSIFPLRIIATASSDITGVCRLICFACIKWLGMGDFFLRLTLADADSFGVLVFLGSETLGERTMISGLPKSRTE